MPESVNRRGSSGPTQRRDAGVVGGDLVRHALRHRALTGYLAGWAIDAARIASFGMEVEVRLFAMLRERAGSESVTVELPDGATVRDAIDAVGREPGLGELIAACRRDGGQPRVRPARTTRSRAGDELALIPPVSGGDRMTVDRLRACRVERRSRCRWSGSRAGRRARGGRDRHLPGNHARRRAARVRGLPRDGGGADGARSSPRRSSATGSRPPPPSTASARSRWARRASWSPPRRRTAARRSRARARSSTASRPRRRSGRRRSRAAGSAGSREGARAATSAG